MRESEAKLADEQVRLPTLVENLPVGVSFVDPDGNTLLASSAFRQYMPDGGTLTIMADEEAVGPGHRSKLPPGRWIRLSVADTGVGMDEATLRRAIEPFFSTKGIGKGTGLGLSMVHGLAAQLGGAFAISSKPGLGTNAELWLPISDQPVRPDVRTDEPTPARGAGRALLVDDEALVRTSTADMLSELGYEVLEASSAEAALQLIDGGIAPDLLVTDHLMPGMSGTDLAFALLQRHPHMPIIVMSGYAEGEGIAPELPRLAKPFRRAELTAMIDPERAKARSIAGASP